VTGRQRSAVRQNRSWALCKLTVRYARGKGKIPTNSPSPPALPFSRLGHAIGGSPRLRDFYDSTQHSDDKGLKAQPSFSSLSRVASFCTKRSLQYVPNSRLNNAHRGRYFETSFQDFDQRHRHYCRYQRTPERSRDSCDSSRDLLQHVMKSLFFTLPVLFERVTTETLRCPSRSTEDVLILT
jgi:hypothetical protein